MAFRHTMGQPLQFPIGCARNPAVHPTPSFAAEDGPAASQPSGAGPSCASYEGNGRLIWSSFASLYGKWCDDKGTFAPPRPYKAVSRSKDDASNHKSGGQISGGAAKRKQREGVVPRMKCKGSKDSLNGGSKLHVDTELSNGRRTPQEQAEEANRPASSLEEMLGVGRCPSGSSDESPTAPSSDGEGLARKGPGQEDARGRRAAGQGPSEDATRLHHAQGGRASTEGLPPASALNEGRERDSAWADMMFQELMDATGRGPAAQPAPPAQPAAAQEAASNHPDPNQRERLVRPSEGADNRGTPEPVGLGTPAPAQMKQALDAGPPLRPSSPKSMSPTHGVEGRAQVQSTAAPSSEVDGGTATSTAGATAAGAAAGPSGLPFFFGRTAAPKGSSLPEATHPKRPRPCNPLPFPWNAAASAAIPDEDRGRRKARRADDSPMPFLWVPNSAAFGGGPETAEGVGHHKERKPPAANEVKQEQAAEQEKLSREAAAGTQPAAPGKEHQAEETAAKEAEDVAGAKGAEAGDVPERVGRPRRRGLSGGTSSRSSKRAGTSDAGVEQAEDLLLKYVLEGRGKDVEELHEGRWCVNEAFVARMAELFAAKRTEAGFKKDGSEGAQGAGAPPDGQRDGEPQAGDQGANAAGSAGAAKKGAPMACPSDSSGSEAEEEGAQARSQGSGGSGSGSLNSGMGQWEKMSCSVRTATQHLLELQRWDKSTRKGAVLWTAWLLRRTRKLPASRVPRPLSLLLFTSLHCVLPRVLASLSDASFIAYGQDKGLVMDAKKLINSVAKSKDLFTPLRWGMLAELLAKCRTMVQRNESPAGPSGPSTSAGTRERRSAAATSAAAAAAAAARAQASGAVAGTAATAGGVHVDRKGKGPADPSVPAGRSMPSPLQRQSKAGAQVHNTSVPMDTGTGPGGGVGGQPVGKPSADGACSPGKKDGSGPAGLNEGQPGSHPGAAGRTDGSSAAQEAGTSTDPLTLPPQRFGGRAAGQSQGFPFATFAKGPAAGSSRARGFGLGFARSPVGCFGGTKGQEEGFNIANEQGQNAEPQDPPFGSSDTDKAAQDVAAKLAGLFSPFPCSSRGGPRPKPGGGWGFRPSTNVAPAPKPPSGAACAPAQAGAAGSSPPQPEASPIGAAPAGTSIPRIFRAAADEPQSPAPERAPACAAKPGLPRWSTFGMPRPGAGRRPTAAGPGAGEGWGARNADEENGAVPARPDLPGVHFGPRGQAGERKRDWHQAFEGAQTRAAPQGEPESSMDNSAFTRLMMSFKPYGAPKAPSVRSRFGAPVMVSGNVELPVGSK